MDEPEKPVPKTQQPGLRRGCAKTSTELADLRPDPLLCIRTYNQCFSDTLMSNCETVCSAGHKKHQITTVHLEDNLLFRS